MINNEKANLSKLEEQRVATEKDIAASEAVVSNLKEELGGLQEVLDEKTKVVEQVKKTGMKSSKVLDQALKEIALCVSGPLMFFCFFVESFTYEALVLL